MSRPTGSASRCTPSAHGFSERDHLVLHLHARPRRARRGLAEALAPACRRDRPGGGPGRRSGCPRRLRGARPTSASRSTSAAAVSARRMDTGQGRSDSLLRPRRDEVPPRALLDALPDLVRDRRSHPYGSRAGRCTATAAPTYSSPPSQPATTSAASNTCPGSEQFSGKLRDPAASSSGGCGSWICRSTTPVWSWRPSRPRRKARSTERLPAWPLHRRSVVDAVYVPEDWRRLRHGTVPARRSGQRCGRASHGQRRIAPAVTGAAVRSVPLGDTTVRRFAVRPARRVSRPRRVRAPACDHTGRRRAGHGDARADLGDRRTGPGACAPTAQSHSDIAGDQRLRAARHGRACALSSPSASFRVNDGVGLRQRPAQPGEVHARSRHRPRGRALVRVRGRSRGRGRRSG